MNLAVIDILVVALLAIALLRGLAIGMIREASSVVAVAGAILAVRFGTEPLAEWLLERGLGQGPLTTRVFVAGVIAIASLLVIAQLGRSLRRRARAAGLGVADRVGGAILGLAEGTLVAGVILLILVAFLGPDHPVLAKSRSLGALETAQEVAAAAGAEEGRNVASPPPKP
jgi:uncharacterized membrane protein required for colicin V production